MEKKIVAQAKYVREQVIGWRDWHHNIPILKAYSGLNTDGKRQLAIDAIDRAQFVFNLQNSSQISV